jgi:hypothetical protein
MEDLIVKRIFSIYSHQSARLAMSQSKEIVSMRWVHSGIKSTLLAPIAPNHLLAALSLNTTESLIAKFIIINSLDLYVLVVANLSLEDV